MLDRIKKLIEKQNLTATQFASEIGVQRSAVSHLLSGRNKPSLDFMLKVKNRFPEIQLDWLLLGKGKMIEKTIKENADTENRPANLFQNEMDLKASTENKTDSEFKETKIPINMAKSEDVPAYGRSGTEGLKLPQKIIVLYSDHTFEAFDAH